jgi:predicted nucleic acid-binding protein
MILVDTSVWVDHFREGIPALAAALDAETVLTHPLVIGELACGNLRNRMEVLALLGELPSAPVASEKEALAFIERRSVMGRGIGYIDVHLLASTALAPGARLWTRDRRLASIAGELDLAIQPGYFLGQPRAKYRVTTRRATEGKPRQRLKSFSAGGGRP